MRALIAAILRERKPASQPINYPSGSCVQAPSGTFYILNNKRYKVGSDRILRSWAFPRVIKTSDGAVAHLRIAGRLGFRSGSVVTNLADAKVYVIEDKLRRQIVDPDMFEILGIKPKDIIVASKSEIELHEEGENL